MQKSISPRALDLRQIFLLHNAEREFLRRESLSRSQRPVELPARATVPQTRQPFFGKSQNSYKKNSSPPRGNCSRSVSSFQCGWPARSAHIRLVATKQVKVGDEDEQQTDVGEVKKKDEDEILQLTKGWHLEEGEVDPWFVASTAWLLGVQPWMNFSRPTLWWMVGRPPPIKKTPVSDKMPFFVSTRIDWIYCFFMVSHSLGRSNFGTFFFLSWPFLEKKWFWDFQVIFLGGGKPLSSIMIIRTFDVIKLDPNINSWYSYPNSLSFQNNQDTHPPRIWAMPKEQVLFYGRFSLTLTPSSKF